MMLVRRSLDHPGRLDRPVRPGRPGHPGHPGRLTRWLAVGLVLAFGLSAIGCGDDAEEAAPPPAQAPDPQPVEPAPEPEPAPDPQPEPDVDPDADVDNDADADDVPAPTAGEAELVWSYLFGEGSYDPIRSLAMDPDGEVLYVGHDATYLMQLADGVLLDAIVYWYPSVDDVDVSPDGLIVGAGLGLGGVMLATPDGDVPPGLEDLDFYPDYVPVRFHSGYDNRLAFSPDGRHLATGNRDGEVWIWDLDAATQAQSLSVADPEFLTGLFYHPSGDLLAALDFSCRLDVWDLDVEAVVHQVELDFSGCYHNAPVAFSPDGTLLAAGLSEDWVQFTRLWNVDGFEQVLDLDMDVRNFNDLAFSPDSSMLATAAWRMPPTVWDVATGDPLYALDSGADPDADNSHPAQVRFTPDGGHVVAGYTNGLLELWRLPGAEVLVAPEREECLPLPIPGDVLFDTGESVLRAEADEALAALAAELAAGFDTATLTFVGHTDSRGDAAANQALSLARAEAVRDWFAGWAEDNAVTGWDFAVDGRGADEPRTQDVDGSGTYLPDAGALNRRVEIQIDAEACA